MEKTNDEKEQQNLNCSSCNTSTQGQPNVRIKGDYFCGRCSGHAMAAAMAEAAAKSRR